ncbi:hypothetical protein [uncultured Wocania sp.]|uniref:hypothetical protein n=1 Tax=uncultured Wocania sp. TaxID=2834404 RepID=UPI0030F4CA54
MKSRAFLVLLIFLVISCSVFKERRRCLKLTENKEILEINNFNDFKNYLEMDNEDLTNILWIVDGEVILNDSIKFVIDEKQFDILSIDKIDQSKLIALYANKNWSFAVVVLTNNCLNKS